MNHVLIPSFSQPELGPGCDEHPKPWRPDVLLYLIEPQNLRGGEGRINTDVLWIPLEASKYFSIGPAPVTISHCGSGKSYHAKVFYEHRDRRKIYDGWRDFIRDGVIREGDVLVFLITYSNVGSVFWDVKHVIPV
ncbi:hypothetical protein FXO38_27023 [Capsicum annuum]|nr:hypothetical protein FXO38_27023 [Capsicum annuum]KAF3632879.1 hypothetical protein FXO37_27286 [Capsicum annuum]